LYFDKEATMTCNVGGLDRIFRIVGGLIVIAWGIYDRNWLGVIGLIPLLTGVFRYCPLYTPLKIDSSKKKAG
jgi:hypothetical protein